MTPDCLQVAIAIIAGAAQYLQRRTDPDASFGGGVSSLFTAPAAAVGGAFDWVKSKITGGEAVTWMSTAIKFSNTLIDPFPANVRDRHECKPDYNHIRHGVKPPIHSAGSDVYCGQATCDALSRRPLLLLPVGSRNSEEGYFQPLSGGDEDFGVDDEQDMHSPVRRP